ncbi:hypothetical protein BED35_21920 [Yersinia enterocolitica]|uniref:YlcI/YnfO family protein n=1 Tax=Yersinia enterocolitica TaxID=630 RepID=UPI0005E77EBE|nr:YlcI/YnfO family protein [Yersinia enterocolitica]AOF13182.1 hypothetical protein BB936_00500 [Yersinia enterocolitica]AOF20787.1 hypothetical protein BED34_21455 [Yersinia enterocolitica]AOF21753.1 hypothetical protein BED33_02600 [Yersinia enterocolitica]AOF28962.1 hypothetical protein BED32_21060 [Yersinia enterocolitica]AOF33135.1 hypothetical protein BED35_21920 [Yersinia enterocolitica]
MATGSSNAKSQSVTARIPHEVLDGMDAVKLDGESNAGFIVTAMQGEIARRQLMESDENKLLSNLNSALEALARIEEIGTKAGENIKAIVEVAQSEIKRCQRKKAKEAPEG